ncbi:multiubiquitin domain-containing protein [Humibacter sp.]|uniref:multiubiquitin domain-containing protein n=1 Tax=Humibacter sp. TaxID=1940291 RepID=UPI003F7ED4F2
MALEDADNREHAGHPGDHHPKPVQIMINGRRHEVFGDSISYEELIRLAFPGVQGEDKAFTVTYRRGPAENREGTLAAGQSVRIKEEMVFNVERTNRS